MSLTPAAVDHSFGPDCDDGATSVATRGHRSSVPQVHPPLLPDYSTPPVPYPKRGQRATRRPFLPILSCRSGGILPRVHCTVTSSGLATLPQVPGQEERTGDPPLDESRARPVVVRHALEVDTQPDQAFTGAVPGVPLDTIVAVRDAQDATGWAAEVPSAASEDVSEEAQWSGTGTVTVPVGSVFCMTT